MAVEGHGATIAFGTSAWVQTKVSIGVTGISREAIDTTDLETSGGETFIPSANYNPGECSLEWNYDADNEPPHTGAVETITITWPNGATHAGSGFLTNFDIGPAVNKGVLRATATLKFTGNITFTAAA